MDPRGARERWLDQDGRQTSGRLPLSATSRLHFPTHCPRGPRSPLSAGWSTTGHGLRPPARATHPPRTRCPVARRVGGSRPTRWTVLGARGGPAEHSQRRSACELRPSRAAPRGPAQPGVRPRCPALERLAAGRAASVAGGGAPARARGPAGHREPESGVAGAPSAPTAPASDGHGRVRRCAPARPETGSRGNRFSRGGRSPERPSRRRRPHTRDASTAARDLTRSGSSARRSRAG